MPQRLSTIETLPKSWSHFYEPPNLDSHLTSNILQDNAPRSTYTCCKSIKIKWDSTCHINGYYVIGVTSILYPRYGVIINIISKDDNSYWVCNSIIILLSCYKPFHFNNTSTLLHPSFQLVSASAVHYCENKQSTVELV